MSTRETSGAPESAPRPKGMPSHLSVLCRMLRSPEENRRCAAALVLAELAPRETPVVEALGEVLADENRVLTNYALDALERIGSRAALPYLLPLLERDDQTRLRAQRAIAALGEPAILDVCRELAQAPRERRRPLIQLLVDLDGKGALATVADALLLEDPELVSEVVTRYARRWSSLSPEARAERREVLLKLLDRQMPHGRHTAQVLALQLLGALADPSARKTVLPYSRPKQPPAVRRAALLALRRLPPPKGKEETAFAELAALLTEADYEHVVAPATEALRALPTPSAATSVLKPLLDSPHHTVRRFAAERLGEIDDPAAATALLKVLRGDDAALRETVQDALRKSPSALAGLVRALRSSESPEDAWTLARLVAARAAELTPALVKAVSEEALHAVERGDARAEAILHALRAADPARHREVLLQHGQRLLKKGKTEDAARILAPLDRGEADAEARFALAVALLKTSPKDLNRKVRLGDRSLSLFAGLVDEPDFPLANRLFADKNVSAEDVFYVAFHLAEGDEAQREVGIALLEKLVKSEGRSKLGKIAKNKLALARKRQDAEQ
ncbi:MAG TPA: HEAT repeat domain-containing protein [Dehalococcoidia bacterium]|nr:HEAT repeat domain-containing protein [Dehalococcoidia bacterium]